MTNQYANAVLELAEIFRSKFPVSQSGLRTIGREAEYPVVKQNGEAADVRKILQGMHEQFSFTPSYEGELLVGLSSPDASYALEVGWGTIEVITGPCDDLFQIQQQHEKAMATLLKVAKEQDANVLGYGIQPFTSGTLELMSPKQRYSVLLDAIGDPWLWFTTTASDQVHLDITREELLPMINFGNLMAPVLIALCANSPIYNGSVSSFCSGREGQMGKIHTSHQRHGMFSEPVVSIEDFISRCASQPFLVNRNEKGYFVDNRPFTEFIAENGVDFDAYLLHEHYIWNTGRPRTAHATMEMRCSCQQPGNEHMAATTLGVALLEAAPAITAYLSETFGKDLWPTLHTYHQEVIEKGLAAEEPAQDFLTRILEEAEKGLKARGRGEEVLMKPLFSRLEKRLNPAQEAIDVYQNGGRKALIDHLTYATS